MPKMNRREIIQSGALLAAGSNFLLKPAFANTVLSLGFSRDGEDATAIPTLPEIDLKPREHLLFDFDWRFIQGHACDPVKDLDFGMNQGVFSKTGDFHFARPGFDDSQ